MAVSNKHLVFITFILFLFSMIPLQKTSAATIEDDDTPNLFNNKQLEHGYAYVTPDYDLGDAPDPTYPTLYASNGASHLLGGNIYLGACVDAEKDGQPNAAATGDDSNAGSFVYGVCTGDDDEDGVSFTSDLILNKNATLDITANEVCNLSAWIDFNADGDWQDTDEQIFADKRVSSGVNSLNFDVPADAVEGDTFARFRCTTESGISFEGVASDGEVEDYKVSITGPGPDINVQRDGTSINDGSTDSLGNPGVGTIQLSYVVANVGAKTLTVDSIVVDNLTNVSSYTPGSATSFAVAAGGQTTFDFEITINAAGNFSFDIHINSDDADESSYVIHVSGNAYELLVLSSGNTSPRDGTVLSVAPNAITVQFNKDVLSDGSVDAANYAGNYMLVEAGANSVFDTNTCAAGVVHDDADIRVDQVNYVDSTRTATININGGSALAPGAYRLFICGTTSIADLFGLELNSGIADTQINFTVTGTRNQAAQLPNTGFPQGVATKLSTLPEKLAYVSTEMTIDIPEINLSLPIVGVPRIEEQWDVAWLNDAVGYLNGTAFPTWMGNTVLTGHVWNADDQPGVFVDLKRLHYGDKIKINAWGQTYTYEVQENMLIGENNIQTALQHEDLDWITLLTCEGYSADTQAYPFRRVVRAVLIDIQ